MALVTLMGVALMGMTLMGVALMGVTLICRAFLTEIGLTTPTSSAKYVSANLRIS